MGLFDVDPLGAALTILIASVIYVYMEKKNNFDRPNFPHAIPAPYRWFHMTEFFYMVGIGNQRKWVQRKRKKLGNIFYGSRLLSVGGSAIYITHPDDYHALLKKEKDLELVVNMPESVIGIDGKNNMQNLPVGPHHASVRKYYSALLSSNALRSFMPVIVERFTALWDKLENEENEVKISEEIRETQFKLMMKILFDIDTRTAKELKFFEEFLANYSLTEAGLFSNTQSMKFKRGMAAKARIEKALGDKFDAIYKERRALMESEEFEDDNYVSSALQAIADSVIKSELKGTEVPSHTLIKQNLYLLLEASHGTTMHASSGALYLLNHPDNIHELNAIRREVSYMKEPTFDAVNSEMPYTDACVSESMRLITHIGNVPFLIQKGKSLELRGETIKGPATVVLNHSNLFDDDEVFPEAAKFIPERWLPGNSKEMSNLARSSIKFYGYGRHVCLGQQLAKILVKGNLYSFLRNESRYIKYDPKRVRVLNGFLFPDNFLGLGFLGQVESQDTHVSESD